MLERADLAPDRLATTSRTVSGEYDTRQISRAIMSRETGGFRFAGVELLQDDDEQLNKLLFDRYLEGRYLLDCLVQLFELPAPIGHQSEWTGTMLVEGKRQQVTLYRKNA